MGLTVIVNVLGVPLVLPSDGVTVIVAVTGTIPVLTAVKAGRLPVPLADSPILVLLLVQLKMVPGKLLVKTTVLVVAPLHTVKSAGCITSDANKE